MDSVIRKKQKRDWYHRNKEAVLAQQKESYRSGGAAKKKMLRYYEKNQLKLCMQTQVYSFLKRLRNDKKKRTQEYLGYTIQDLMIHLESTFQDGMTWDNYGEWHVDHIIPKTKFDENQVRECFALTNLQALWMVDNIKKSNKILT